MNVAAALASPAGRALLFLARIVFWAAAAVLAFALCRRGLTLSDEGDLLSSALAMVEEGKVLYRDLDLFVTPGAWYLNAAIFSITGPSVIATRIAAGCCMLATMAVTRRIAAATGGPLWGDFAAGLIAIFAVWAWPAWTWSFYSPWATLFGLAAFACTLEWMHSRRGSWLVACGVALGLTIAFKQNYGVFAAVGCALAVVLDEIATAPPRRATAGEIGRRSLHAAALLSAGGALVLIPGVLYLASQGALGAAFDLLLIRPFQGFIDSHSIRYLRFGDLWRQAQVWAANGMIYMAVPITATSVAARWPAPAASLAVVLHVLLYWIPILAFAGLGLHGLLRLRRHPAFPERALLATVVFAAVYFLGVFPRADFNHLINVYQPILGMLAAAAAVHFGQGRWRLGTWRKAGAGAAAALFLCFAGVAAVWMNDLRKTVWLPIKAPRAGILVDTYDSQMLNDEIDLVRTLTVEGEPVFALPNLSMIPFLAERRMPTRYRNFYAVHIGHDLGAEAARDIERSEARVVLATYDNFFSDPGGMLTYGSVLTEYLRRHFRPAYSMGGQNHMVLVRREKPLEETPFQSLWLMCDVRPGGPPATFGQERLLFPTLFHSFRGAWAAHNQGLTSCQLQVPSEARMRIWLELRQPAPALEPVTTRAEVWIFRSRGRPRRVLKQEWPLAAEVTNVRKTGKEFEIDLSRWKGEVVNIVLRTLVEGTVPDAPFDHLGLTVLWNDGRIESPDYADAAEDAQVAHGEAGDAGGRATGVASH